MTATRFSKVKFYNCDNLLLLKTCEALNKVYVQTLFCEMPNA